MKISLGPAAAALIREMFATLAPKEYQSLSTQIAHLRKALPKAVSSTLRPNLRNVILTEMPTPLKVRDCLCLHARRTARLLTQFYDDSLRHTELRITQFLLLAAIDEAQPIAHQPLADILGMDRTTLTRNLAILEREGLAVISKGTGDKRESRIRLKPAGRLAVQRAMPYWQQAQQQILGRLDSVPNPTTGSQALTFLDRIGSLVTPGEGSA